MTKRASERTERAVLRCGEAFYHFEVVECVGNNNRRKVSMFLGLRRRDESQTKADKIQVQVRESRAGPGPGSLGPGPGSCLVIAKYRRDFHAPAESLLFIDDVDLCPHTQTLPPACSVKRATTATTLRDLLHTCQLARLVPDQPFLRARPLVRAASMIPL